MNSNEFLESSLPYWGKMLIARKHFESELLGNMKIVLNDLKPVYKKSGITLSNETEADNKREESSWYYYAYSKILEFPGLGKNDIANTELRAGIYWDRNPEREIELMPSSFIWISYDSSKKLKEYFKKIESVINDLAVAWIYSGSAFFCMDGDLYYRKSINELIEDQKTILNHLSEAVHKVG